MIFWQKSWTNPFAKCRLFSTIWELYFWGPKSFNFYTEYQEMFLSEVFRKKKKHIRNRSIFWQKPWTNSFAKCRFFLECFRSFLLLSKKHSLLFKISKNVSLLLFLLKTTIWEKGHFLTKTKNPLQNVDYFRLCENFTFQV